MVDLCNGEDDRRLSIVCKDEVNKNRLLHYKILDLLSKFQELQCKHHIQGINLHVKHTVFFPLRPTGEFITVWRDLSRGPGHANIYQVRFCLVNKNAFQ